MKLFRVLAALWALVLLCFSNSSGFKIADSKRLPWDAAHVLTPWHMIKNFGPEALFQRSKFTVLYSYPALRKPKKKHEGTLSSVYRTTEVVDSEIFLKTVLFWSAYTALTICGISLVLVSTKGTST
jgi:hypothetical protein